MATTEFSVALTDVQEYQPDIAEYGITDFDTQLQHAEDDVIRQIREEWWERYRHTVRYRDITKVTSIEMDQTKLTPAQWTRCVVYRALSRKERSVGKLPGCNPRSDHRRCGLRGPGAVGNESRQLLDRGRRVAGAGQRTGRLLREGPG